MRQVPYANPARRCSRAAFRRARDGRWLVEGVDLAIRRGEIVTLIGPNGSGKSTTAKIVTGVLKPDVGTVERGFSKAPDLAKRLPALETTTSPFALDSPSKTREVRWARPELVAQVGLAEWTNAGRMRQPRYLGLRTDKAPQDVVRERPE